MSTVAGTWKITISSLLGSVNGTLELRVDGDRVTATGRSDAGSLTFREGTLEGAQVRIPVELSSPMEVRATAVLTVDGDTMKGRIVGAPIPGVRVKGARIARG